MMAAGVALGAAGRLARPPQSATIGAVVFLAGAALVYWALFRSRGGEGLFGLGTGLAGAPGAPGSFPVTPGFGGGKGGGGGGGSGSF